ncbi:MAG: site-specific integrase [Kiritimatiellia bacterium]
MKQQHALSIDSRNGHYYTRIQVSGIMKRFKFGTNRREAEQQLRQTEKDIAAGKVTFSTSETTMVTTSDGKQDMHLAELANRYLEWLSANRSKSTYELRKNYIQQFLMFMGKCMVSSVTKAKIAEFPIWAIKRKQEAVLARYKAWNNSRVHKNTKPRLNRSGRRNRSKSILTPSVRPVRQTEYLRHIKTMFRWGDEMEVCSCPVRKFPPILTPPPATKLFTDKDMQALLTTAPEDFRDMLLFGLLTGLRPQELRTLRKTDVILEGERFRLNIALHKTSSSSKNPIPRSVPLTDVAAQILVRQMKPGMPSNAIIFRQDNGQPYSAGTFRARLHRLCTKANVPKRPPYALRHSFATTLAGDGTNMTIIGQLMGHSTLRTTQRYIANNFEYQQTAMDRLAERFSTLTECKTETKVVPKVVPDKNANHAVKTSACVSACRKAG